MFSVPRHSDITDTYMKLTCPTFCFQLVFHSHVTSHERNEAAYKDTDALIYDSLRVLRQYTLHKFTMCGVLRVQ